MTQEAHINLDTLEAYLEVIENGQVVRYTITLAPDRSGARLEREVFEASEFGSPGHGSPNECREVTFARSVLADPAFDPGFGAVVTWLARGMIGIPLEYGARASVSDGGIIFEPEIAAAGLGT